MTRAFILGLLAATILGNESVTAQAREVLWTQHSADLELSCDGLECLVHPIAGPGDIGAALSVEEQQPLGLTALVAAGAGFFGGATLGYRIERKWYSCGCDDPGLLGMGIGGFVGPAILTPLAVHKANDRQGSLRRGYQWSAFIAGAGMTAVFIPVPLLALGTFLVAPAVHAISAVKVERRTAEEAAARENRP